MASPPASSISATTLAAADSEEPTPSTDPPRSLTTTRAPRRASSSAYVRPRPPPAPVTMATRPSKVMSDIPYLQKGQTPAYMASISLAYFSITTLRRSLSDGVSSPDSGPHSSGVMYHFL